MILFLGAHILDGFRPISLEIGIQHSDFAKNGPQTDRILYSGDVEDKATPLSASPPLSHWVVRKKATTVQQPVNLFAFSKTKTKWQCSSIGDNQPHTQTKVNLNSFYNDIINVPRR